MTKTEVVNLALSKLGASLIGSLGDVTVPASHHGGILYEPTLEEILRSYRWSMAEREISLAETTDYSSERWTYAYRLPPHWVRILEVTDGDPDRPLENFSRQGGFLLCN